jgi:single-strand DNA-binding protein
MNKSFLIGRISSDLNLKYTPNGNAVCEFNIAINRIGSEGTDFLNCTVWNKQAENLVKYQSKGSLISVEGSNRVDKYQNEQGENRYKHYILVNNIQFLESKKDVASESKKEDVEPFTPVDDFNEDDYPF